MNSFTVTEVVTATRCPRQLVLLRDKLRVLPFGGMASGAIAHHALAVLVKGAPTAPSLLTALALPEAAVDSVQAACYALAYAKAHERALRAASTMDGADLTRLDMIVRNIAQLIATLLCRARGKSRSAAHAIEQTLLASEDPITLDIGSYEIRGAVDLLCRDVATGQTWVWDLKTYAGTDRAQEEQVRLYSLAYQKQGIDARAALLHVTGDRIELREAPRMEEIGVAALGARLARMSGWLEGTEVPPAAPEPATCRACPAQAPCWARWGRTLPDAETDDRNGTKTVAPTAPPKVPDAPQTPPRRSTPGERPKAKLQPPAPAQPSVRPTPPAPPAPAAVPVQPLFTAALDPEPLWIGNGELDKNPVRLDAMELPRHVAVFGASGSGKTHFAKSIVEEAALAGIPSLIFDVQGDLAQFAQLAQLAAEAPPQLATRQAAYAERVEVRIFTPASDAGLRVSLNPLRLPDPDLGEDARAFCQVAIAENLLGAINVPRTWREQAKEYLAQHLEAAPASLTLEDLVERVREPADLPGAPLLSKSAHREMLSEQLRMLTEGTQRFLFQRGRRLEVAELVKATDPGKVPLNIVWLNALDEGTKPRFIAMMLSEIYAWMLRNPSSKPQLLLYLDEVGPYMPPRGEPPSKQILKRIFQEGRKYGVCGLFCTQNFTNVDYKVLSQANTMIMGRIISPQDKDRARKILPAARGFDPGAAAQRLGNAASGTFLASGGRFPAPRWLKGRPLIVHHGAPWGEDEIAAHTSDRLRRHFGG